jgi:hypothetical protein
MTATYVGSLSVGASIPAATASAVAGAGGINAAFPDVAARLSALQAQVIALAGMPPLPSFVDMLAKAQALVVSITLAIATPGLPPPPTIATAIAALSATIGDLVTMTAALNAQLTVITTFQAQLAAAGVEVVAFSGTRNNFGTEVQTELNAHLPNTTVNGVALVTADGATWTAMSNVFKVTP